MQIVREDAINALVVLLLLGVDPVPEVGKGVVTAID